MMMLAFILIRNCEGATLDYVGIQCDPSVVGETNANLYIQTTIKTLLPINGYLRLTLPSTQEVSIKSGNLTCSISGDVTQSNLVCSANTAGLVITAQVKANIQSGSTIQLNVLGGFKSPPSSADTSSFILETLDATGVTIIDSLNTGIILNVSPDSFTSATITQIDSVQVGQSTSVLVSVQVQNQLLAGANFIMTFPKWNPSASTTQQLPMVTDTSNVNVNSTITCKFDTSTDTLRVTNAFTNGLEAGTQFQFVLASLKNPLSFSPITIQIQTTNSAGTGTIEKGTTTIAPSAAALINSATTSTSADDSTVQTFSNFRLEFVNPLPLNTGTVVTVIFPSQFTFDSKLNTVQGFGMFGSIRNLNFSAVESQRSVKITNGIDSYKASGIKGIMIFQQIKMPSFVKATDSISIFLTDSNGFQIANVTSGIVFTPTSGTIDAVTVNADQKLVNSNTSLSIKFQPKHSLTTSSLIVMQLPSNLDIDCAGFKAAGGFSSSIDCAEVSTNNFQFTSIFSSTYAYSASQALEITFANVVNPPSAQNVIGISIATYERVTVVGGQQNFLVDLNNQSTLLLYTPLPSQFLSQNISVSSTQTYTSATFTFNILPDNPITQNGLIKIILPSEIAVVGTVTCAGILNIATSLSCSLSGSTLMITNGYSSASLARAQLVKFSISGLRTPLSTKTSSSFSVFTMDQNNFVIDQITSLLSVTMLEGKPITSIKATTDSNTVADLATITVSFTPSVPLQNTDQIFITLPDQITPPIKSDLLCNGADSLSKTAACDINGQILTLTLGLKSSPSKENSATITVKFRPAKNPTSTKPTSEFQVLIKNQNGYIISQSASKNGGKFQVGTPSEITKATFTALDNRQQAFTTITVNFTTNNLVPAGGYLEVDFTNIYFNIKTDQTVKCTSNLIKNDNVSCEFPRDGTFLVKNIFPNNYAGGQSVDFTINNVLIDVRTKMTTPSWTVTTITPDGYLIDRVSDILTLTFSCNTPCLTCLANNPNYCLTCNSATNNTIFYNNKCLDKCPDSLYYDQQDNQCKPCDPKCKTCSFDNPSECTSCNIFNTDYAYLDGVTCTSGCGYGYFANNITATCDACQSPCQSCNGTPTTCLNCLQTIDNKYMYLNKCYNQCPSSFIADENNLCIPCDSNCLTCAGSTNYCSSCKAPLLLSEYDNTCVSTCPFGKTVYNSLTKICQRCDQSCQTCQNKTTFCTSCVENLNLWPALGTCQGECSADRKYVGFNGICTACSSSCLTCVNKPDSCLSCASGQFLYDYTCVNSCPSGYEPDINDQCVIKGLRCPFGQKVNAAGTACELKVQICEDGNVLNAAKDRCIPKAGNVAPFPLCFACLFLAIIVIISWFKYKETLIASNVIAAMSIIETIGILVQIGLAYEMGIYSTFALSLVSILFLYGSNLFFTIVFLKQVSTDPAFKYWGLSYKITQNTVIVVGSVINFKFFRVIYGRFFGKDHFNAAFDDPEAFFKPFTFVSVFSIITTMLPLLVANIIGLVFIEFGYQVEMCCIELTIIELVLLALMIYEKITLKKYAMKQHQYYKVEPKFIDSAQVNVMSSMIDEQTNSYSMKTINPTLMRNSKTTKTEENLLTISQNMVQNKEKKMPAGFLEYYERRRMLERLISKIYQKDAVISNKGETTLDLIAKLQEEEILRRQERHCRSFRDLRELDEDFADQGAADPELQNFISAPNSPREKEMLHNPFFMGRIAEFKKAMKLRDQYDNVYAESKPAYYFPMRDTKLISVKVQTNLLELLAIDDMTRVRTQNLRNHDSSEEEYIEENLNGDYAQGLIDDVLDTFKEHQFTKQRRRLPKSRLAQIPNFDLTDIIGDFDIDDNANSIIIRGKDGKLNDREGRKVNKRGYLIDNEGNIVTTRGILIFKVDELDSDDEIPAPFCFEKKKENLFKIEGIAQYSQKAKKKNIQDQEDEIEREYRMLRQKNASHHSSVDSLMGETPSKYNKKNKRVMPGDDDGFLSKIVQPMQAKTKSELLKSGADNIKRNAPSNVGRSSQRNQRNNIEAEATKATQDSSIVRGVGGGLRNTNTSVKKSTSIGGYDTSAQDDIMSSARDLFFTSAMGNQNRNRQNNQMAPNLSNSFMSRSNQNQYQSQELAMQINQERISKINQLKDTLGATQEDRMLLKQLAKFESNLLSRLHGQESKSSNTLAKKNLKKVYGKVKSKMSEDFHSKPPRRPFASNFFEDDAPNATDYSNNLPATSKSKVRPTHDSRLKNLENIYIKNINQDRRTASQLQRQKNWAPPQPVNQQQLWIGSDDDINLNFTSGGQNTVKHRMMQNSMQDTGVESSDQDEIRMRQQLNKMQAIIDKGQKINSQIKMPKANTKLFDGGWI